MKNYFTSIFLLFTCSVFAQEANDVNTPFNGREASKKPRLGGGFGVFTYFGDVKDNTFDHPFTSSSAFEIYAERNINKYLTLNVKGIIGKMTINERKTDRNLNFQSKIMLGSVNIVYDFNNFYKRPKVLQPYISVGIAYFNFDSKTDKLDANGNPYYYWRDGSIRNMSEHTANSENAIEVNRDYKYETDLRKMNTEGRGRYSTLSFAIPVELGVLFRITNRTTLKLGTSFYFTFTDLIDNVSDKGVGVMQGNKAKDNFLYTSFSLNYNLFREKQPVEENKFDIFKDVDFVALDTLDQDKDGVIDFYDRCAFTRQGTLIDKLGCPLDDDKDGIENEFDQQENSKEMPPVNVKGINYTDSIILSEYIDTSAIQRLLIPIAFANQIRLYGYPVKDFKQSLIDSITSPNNALAANSKVDSVFKAMDKSYEETQKIKAGKSISETTNNTSVEKKKATTVERPEANVTQKAVKVNETTPTETNSDGSPIKKGDKIPADDDTELTKVNTVSADKLKTDETLSTTETGDEKQSLGFTSTDNIVPERFRKIDFNNDGIITGDEVLKAIDLFTEKAIEFSSDDMLALIDYYDSKMKNAKIIDYGISKGIYIDGVLKIVKAEDLIPSKPKRVIPDQFRRVDMDSDGVVTSKEVERIILMHLSGSKIYSKDYVNELIDYFFE